MMASLPSSYLHYFQLFIIQFVMAFLLFSYKTISSINSHHEDTQISIKLQSDFVILLWTWPFGFKFPLNQCKKPFDAPKCFFTANHNIYKRANAVIFHHRDVCSSRSQMPQILRPEGQYWVWFNLESPSHSPNLNFMNKRINLTMSYRCDSDIFTPYGWLEQNENLSEYNIPNKTQLVAWTVSNWKSNSKRVKYYHELKKHIPIDVYGRQHLPLDRSETHTILSKYKFYLAFENSIHTDYITEKLWRNALYSGCVPVVLGPPRENYERFIPSDSFIHIDDFPNAQELASYLLELDKDNEKYEKYFKWRTKLQPVKPVSFETHYCKACVALHNSPSYRTRSDLVKWYT